MLSTILGYEPEVQNPRTGNREIDRRLAEDTVDNLILTTCEFHLHPPISPWLYSVMELELELMGLLKAHHPCRSCTRQSSNHPSMSFA